ncbi:MAG: hypothetical protein AAB393_01735, partial [Bacteroidota bacterium]
LEAAGDNVTSEGCEIKNYGPDGNTNADGVVAWNSSNNNVIVRDNYMHHLGYAGVLTGNGWGGPQGVHDNWQVTYNKVESPIGAYGFDMENVKNSSISNNEILNIPFYNINVIALATESGASVTTENVVVSNNVLSGGNDRNINLFAWTDGGADRTAVVQNITVSNNSVSGIFTMMDVWKTGPGTTTIQNITITGNTLTVNNPKAAGNAVSFGDVGGTSVFSGNAVTLTGALAGGVTFFHAMNIGGAGTGTLTINNNQLDGNDLGALNCGFRLRNTLPATAVLNFSGNTITEFANGIRSDDLTAGVGITVYSNSITSNSNKGILNGSGVGQLVDASSNWWGVNTEVGVAAAVSTNVDYTPWLNNGTDAEPVTPGFQG